MMWMGLGVRLGRLVLLLDGGLGEMGWMGWMGWMKMVLG